MKKSLFVIVVVLIPLLSFSQKEYGLSDAQSQRIISLSVKPNEKSTHYLKALVLELNNRTSSEIKINIENGLVFFSNDTSDQDFVVTKGEMITLKPMEKKEIAIYSMCSEMHNSVPEAVASYTLSGPAPEKLGKLTSFIEKKKYYGTQEAQASVWALCSDLDLSAINGYDTAACRQLVQFLAELTGKPIPPPPTDDDYEHNYYSQNLKIRIGGSFDYKFSFVCGVRIAMFDKENRIVRELYFNAAEQVGEHRFEWEFDASVYTDDIYYIRFLVDDEIWAEGEMDLREKE